VHKWSRVGGLKRDCEKRCIIELTITLRNLNFQKGFLIYMESLSEARPNILISMDPSFHGLGISVLAEKSLYFSKLCCETKIKSFQNAYFGTIENLKKLEKLVKHIEKIHFKNEKKLVKEFVFEFPPTAALYAPGLFMLDGFILDFMLKKGYKASGVDCKLCRSVVGIPKAKKEIVMPEFVNGYLPNLKSSFFDIGIIKVDDSSDNLHLHLMDVEKDKIKSHDISESFIIMLTYSYVRNWGQKIFPKFEKFCSKEISHFNIFDIKEG
jgi:hypothetical protein